ncbi:MAG: hypothetical protein ACKO3N_12270, partial [Verrucomicrobiota bacterium]
TLRDKGFSYREIAAWLAGRGVAADHNAVYRVIGGEPPADSGLAGGPSPRKPRTRRAPGPAVPAPAPASTPPAFEAPPLLD